MFSGISTKKDASVHAMRIKDLIAAIRAQHPNKKGLVFLSANFERDTLPFHQDSSFFYYTGVKEPGAALCVDSDGKAVLYIPRFAGNRAQWVNNPLNTSAESAKTVGVSRIEWLGEELPGYQVGPFFNQEAYSAVIERMKQVVNAGGSIFTLNPADSQSNVDQRLVLVRIAQFAPECATAMVDISAQVANQRRVKDMHELEQIYRAVSVTEMAHEAAAQVIEKGNAESDVQASLEYIMTSAGARCAFPSIVATGKNATILHYVDNDGVLNDGDLVVVDIGAQYEGYCADITRTYPVSGAFTKRQRELYNIVLETQEYIANLAKPGMWLSNKDVPEKSLNHLARAFLAKKGLDQYFTHGIGHFLGLDVHDVGDYSRALQEGDVITIEPGLYIPQEGIGIRIEDNYWIVKDNAVCLSENLPKKAEDIEKFLQEGPDLDEEGDLDDDEEDSYELDEIFGEDDEDEQKH